jgi:hypothetical protein
MHFIVFTESRSTLLSPLYVSPNNVRVIKSRRVRWAGRVARIADMRNLYRILVKKNLKGRDDSEYRGIDVG